MRLFALACGPDPGEEAPEEDRRAFLANREVRHTVIRVITAHLKDDAAVSWQGLNFDFTGVIFDGGDFARANFSGGTVDFRFAKFTGGEVHFSGARFAGSAVVFAEAEFLGGAVHFSDPGHWTVPPSFPWTGAPPPGVTFPDKENQSRA